MNSNSLKIVQELDSHLQRRKELKQMLRSKNISMLDSPDQTISNIIEPNLQPNQSFLYVGMKQELTAKGFNEFRFLGQGAQGLVLVAKEQLTNRRYAIKGVYIRDQNGNVNPIIQQQVEQEVKLLKACKGSPFVLNLIDQINGKDFTFLVLSECKGTLSQIIEQSPNKRLNELSSIKYAKDIAEGLYCIHSQKCLVNDIKMDNILIDHNGNAVVADFGFADCLSKTNGFGMNDCKGNDFYKAPECFLPSNDDEYNQEYINRGLNVSNKPSMASEACSLGYMIYTMISGWKMQLMFNKHLPLSYNNDFLTFTYEKQLRYIIDGLTKFNPIERLSIKEVLIILKGIVSFEFNLDEKFVQLMKDDTQNAVNQYFNSQIEFVQCFKNQYYPIIQDEVSLMQKIFGLMQQQQADNSNQINQLNQTIIQQKQQIQSLDGKVKNQQIEYQKMNQTNIQLKEQISSLEAKLLEFKQKPQQNNAQKFEPQQAQMKMNQQIQQVSNLQEFIQKPQQNNAQKFQPQQTQMKMNQQIQQVQPQQVANTWEKCEQEKHEWKQTQEKCESGGENCLGASTLFDKSGWLKGDKSGSYFYGLGSYFYNCCEVCDMCRTCGNKFH